eukprot:tig00021463_g21614.t1
MPGSGDASGDGPSKESVLEVFTKVNDMILIADALEESNKNNDLDEISAQQQIIAAEFAASNAKYEAENRLQEVLEEAADLEPSKLDPDTIASDTGTIRDLVAVLTRLEEAYKASLIEKKDAFVKREIMKSQKDIVDKQKATLAGNVAEAQEMLLDLISEAEPAVKSAGFDYPSRPADFQLHVTLEPRIIGLAEEPELDLAGFEDPLEYAEEGEAWAEAELAAAALAEAAGAI